MCLGGSLPRPCQRHHLSSPLLVEAQPLKRKAWRQLAGGRRGPDITALAGLQIRIAQ